MCVAAPPKESYEPRDRTLTPEARGESIPEGTPSSNLSILTTLWWRLLYGTSAPLRKRLGGARGSYQTRSTVSFSGRRGRCWSGRCAARCRSRRCGRSRSSAGPTSRSCGWRPWWWTAGSCCWWPWRCADRRRCPTPRRAGSGCRRSACAADHRCRRRCWTPAAAARRWWSRSACSPRCRCRPTPRAGWPSWGRWCDPAWWSGPCGLLFLLTTVGRLSLRRGGGDRQPPFRGDNLTKLLILWEVVSTNFE